MTTAGVGLIRALEILRNSPPSRPFRPALNQLIERLNSGYTFTESLRTLGRWLPAFDLALIESGEKSGRLDQCFRILSEYYRHRAQFARTVIHHLLFPAATLHVALVVFPTHLLPQLFLEGKIAPFVQEKISTFVPLYIVVGLVIYACQGRHGERWRSLIERFSMLIPYAAHARKDLALARLSISLEGLLSAGVSVTDAWEIAAASSGSPALNRTVQSWRSSIEAGQPPSELVRESKVFPELFSSLYTTGELSGQLDDTLRRLYEHYQDEGFRSMKLLSEWVPRVIYFMIVILIGYQVISFWTGYYSGMMKVIE